MWRSPVQWSGPDPGKYWSFDTLDGLAFMAGTQHGNIRLVPGKVWRIPMSVTSSLQT